MRRVAFVNMPFADWNRPSFALSQLAALLHRDFGEQVSVEVHYLKQDVAQYLGAPLYEAISVSHDHVDIGLGDWLFRQIAFPYSPDNAVEYFQRFYRGNRWSAFRERILGLRAGLRGFCADLLDRHDIAGADIVGFSSMFAQHVPCLAVARQVKERNPDALVVIGGANCEAPMGAVAEHVPAVDFLFSGPAPGGLPPVMRYVLDGRRRPTRSPGVVSSRNCHDPAFKAAIDHNGTC